MAKRGENIYKRKDGRWEGRYIKKRTPERQIIYGYVYGKRYADVKEKLTILKAKQLTTTYEFQRYEGTYEQWLGHWMSGTVRNNVKETTYSNYFRMLNRHILPELGMYRLYKLDEECIQQFVDGLINHGLSAGSIRLVTNLVKQSLNEAVRKHYLSSNPCAFVQLPKLEYRSVRALSIKEQRALEALAFMDSECSPILLALYSGMRIGEISGLKWQDIDFEQNIIYVNRTISRIVDETSVLNKTKLIAGTPKTQDSSRKIPLAKNLKAYLLEKKEHAVCDYVIHSRKNLAEPRVINYRFKKVIKETAIEHIHFHTLRHTFATRCLEQGVDIASLSKILGHRSIKLTLDTYADSLMEQRQEAMGTVDALLTYG